MREVHVIGNGPSALHFDYPPGTWIGCNATPFDCKWTMMLDSAEAERIKRGLKLRCPVVCSDEVYQWLLKYNLVPSLFKVHHVFPPTKLPNNCGIMACVLALLLEKPTHLHLWGIDSLWSLTLDSHINAERNKFAPTLTMTPEYWIDSRNSWRKLFFRFSRIKFVLHSNTQLHTLPKNVECL